MTDKKKKANSKAPAKTVKRNAGNIDTRDVKKNSQDNLQPVRIIVEVLVRTEQGAAVHTKENILLEDVRFALEDNSTANFSYIFSLDTGVKVLHVIVGEVDLPNPADSGEFFSPVRDLRVPPHIQVTVIAVSAVPGNSGTLSLNYNNKAVFATPEPFISFASALGFTKDVTLPE